MKDLMDMDLAALAARVDRVESLQAIQQLPVRYALAVDGRDIDAWVALFVEDVNCGRHGRGREALRAFIAPQLRGFYRSIHQICGHQVEFVDADHATGAVYCRAEHEDDGKWIVMAIVYFDEYARRDGRWYFVRRREKHWYSTDWQERPAAPFNGWPGHDQPPTLPADFASWSGVLGRDRRGRRDRIARAGRHAHDRSTFRRPVGAGHRRRVRHRAGDGAGLRARRGVASPSRIWMPRAAPWSWRRSGAWARQALFVRADATVEADVAAAVAQAVEAHGPLAHAFNNVGLSRNGTLETMTREDWDWTLAASLTSTWLAMKHELPVMVARGGGSIVNTASMAGKQVTPVAPPAYSAAKAGVIHLTAYAAALHAADGVRVNSVSPGLVATPAIARRFTAAQQAEIAAGEQRIARAVQPEEVAAAVLFLCSDAAAMITGTDTEVCGGRR